MPLRRGIAINVAITTLVLVAVILGIVLYTIIWRPVTSSKPPEKGIALLIIEEADYNGSYIILYIRNDGPKKVYLSRAYIETPNGTIYVAKYPPKYGQLNLTLINGGKPILPPNRKIKIVIIGNFSVDPYKNIIKYRETYGIKVIANDGSETSTTLSVP